MITVEELRALLKGTILEDCYISEADGKIYLGYDFPENEDGDSWDEYCDVQDALHQIGYELIESYSEHDHISGIVRKL